MDWLKKFMAGRYGVDQLAIAQLSITIVLAIVYMFFPYKALRLFYLLILAYAYIRIFSKDINKRYEENLKFLKIISPIRNRYTKLSARFKSKRDYKYFKCPSCQQKIRVPKGKGKIKVTCPKCKNTFHKKS